LEVEENLGPALSSQRVVSKAATPIIARMDADDITHPERLRRQLEPHGTVMFRRAVFDFAGGYCKECEYWEDQDLVARMAAVSKVMVIPQVLYQLRQWTRNTRARSPHDRLEQAMDLAYRAAARLEQNRSYEDLLAGRPNDDRLDPRVFVSLGAMTLWAGGKPRAFGRMLRRGRLSLDAQRRGPGMGRMGIGEPRIAAGIPETGAQAQGAARLAVGCRQRAGRVVPDAP
jgi:hypothetical protein